MTTSSRKQENYDPKALTEAHLPLVWHCMKRARYRYPDIPADTTLQGVAREALWRAALRYDPSCGASFKTYAYYRVLGTFTLDVVKRHVLEGESLRALAQSLNVSYRSVLRRYKQGLARLRAEWGVKAPAQ